MFAKYTETRGLRQAEKKEFIAKNSFLMAKPARKTADARRNQ